MTHQSYCVKTPYERDRKQSQIALPPRLRGVGARRFLHWLWAKNE